MNLRSWQLVSHVLFGRETLDNPVYLREAEHRPLWHVPARWSTLSLTTRRALVIVVAVTWILVVLYVNNLLVFLLPPLFLLAVATALTIAPIVVQERLSQSWETLLTTPYDMEVILLNKVAGAIARVRVLVVPMGILLGVLAAGVGLISLALVPIGQLRTGSIWSWALCGTLVLLPILGSVGFVIDRVQQYLLMLSAALAAASSADSLRTALPASTAAVLLAWLGEMIAAAALVGIYAGHNVLFEPGQLLALATLGPTVIYISQLDLAPVVIFTLGTLLVREALITALWAWSVRRARQQVG